jgi:GNAT superfamily N-acetyltransferase
VIRALGPEESECILAVVNDAASAYRGIIPKDLWHEPYMSAEYLRGEMEAGVRFHGLEEDRALLAVMGIQDVAEVTLVRHAYVRTDRQRAGLGGELFEHLRRKTRRPMLVGTWTHARWAVRFYEKHHFRKVGRAETLRLLCTYWDIPSWQVEKSIVLADDLAWLVIVDRRAS